MRPLLAHRDARVYLAGQAFSLFGDSSLWLAMGIWVKTLTHSNAEAGLVFFFTLHGRHAGTMFLAVCCPPLASGTT